MSDPLLESIQAKATQPAELLKNAVCEKDAVGTRNLFARYPELRATIDQPLPGQDFGEHALFLAVQRSDLATVDALIQAGANINKRTEWWAGGFGVLDECHPEFAPSLLERGAKIDVHAAARLGMVAELEQLLRAEPSSVNARGGDGQTALHFASTTEVAGLLLEHEAVIDARDIDHESTPAQYMAGLAIARHYTKSRQDVARFLVSQGCYSDLLMAAALGDLELTRRHLDEDPASVGMTVSDRWFPKRDARAGGTIYIWSFGPNRTAHVIARQFGHERVFQLLMDRTPAELKLALACELGDEAAFRELLRMNPRLASSLSADDLRKLPDAAQSNNGEAVRLMLEAGWPVDARGDMGAAALHWAAYNGNAELTRMILSFQPAIDLKSLVYDGTALEWAIHGSGSGSHRDTGDYVGTAQALLQAGATVPHHASQLEPSEAVERLLQQN